MALAVRVGAPANYSDCRVTVTRAVTVPVGAPVRRDSDRDRDPSRSSSSRRLACAVRGGHGINLRERLEHANAREQIMA